MNIREAYNIEDLRRIAERRLPRVAYDYLERGAEDDVTLIANHEALAGCRNVAAITAEVLNRPPVVERSGT